AIWISDRRDPSREAKIANAMAPKAWLDWIKYGSSEIERLKRRVTRYHIVPKRDQVAAPDSTGRKVLESIYTFYEPKRHRFEALASLACESMIKGTGASYH